MTQKATASHNPSRAGRFTNKRHLLTCLAAILLMGFFVSLLIEVNLGLDPFTFMNVSISDRLPISFGTWELMLNALLFVIVILAGRDCIGPGTFLNMILIGYVSDFCRWIWGKILPPGFFMGSARVPVFILSLALFILCASLYMNADMGVSPYDAIPMIISRKLPKISFRIIRICYDFLAILIGVIFGGTPAVGNILMALFLGPAITLVGGWMKRVLFKENSKTGSLSPKD